MGTGHVYLNQIAKMQDVKELFPDGAHEFEIKDQKEIVIDLNSDVPPSAREKAARLKSATGAKGGS